MTGTPTTSLAFMLVPGSPNAPLFSGDRVWTFLDVIRWYADATGLSENDKVDQIYYYLSDRVQDTIRNSPAFDIDLKDKKWDVASKKLLALYGSSDPTPTVMLASLQSFCQKQNSKLAFISKATIEKYVRTFEIYSSALVKNNTITTTDSDYYFVMGLPESLKQWLETQIPYNKKTKDKPPSQEDILGHLYRQFNPNSLFYAPWRQPDAEDIGLDDESN
uniref:Uncharacterized protein n=1 Tax=Moniliophthora roreri TaxID=221103 RepID=A0A0W0G612_MONRR